MPGLALEKLTACIHKYFGIGVGSPGEDEDDTPDVTVLYRKVLGLSGDYLLALPTYTPALKTSHLVYYYWRSYW